MISRERLIWDGRIQLSLGGLGLVSWLASWPITLIVFISLLLLWQMISAWELYVDYKHKARRPYLWLLPLLIIIAVGFWPLGVVPCLVGIGVFGWHTIHDYLIVRRRPRSFWDI